MSLTDPKAPSEDLSDYIQVARDVYTNDDIEIDDINPATSKGDGGCWVAAWVWVADEEARPSDDESDDDSWSPPDL